MRPAPADPAAPASADPPKCGIRATRTSFAAGATPLDRLIRFLIAPTVRRPVIDRTGLTGTFDFSLQFSRDNAAAADVDLPPLTTALDEQLGLKLESIREVADVLVIDHLERPTPN